jgi:iron-sulfur cluster assembly protein
MRQIISITENAAKRVQELLAKNPDSKGIRVDVASKGCSGFAYKVEYADAPRAGDEVVSHHGITIYVAASAVLYLAGSEMDYIESEIKSGFEFKNPNEQGRCGCGESFYVGRPDA